MIVAVVLAALLTLFAVLNSEYQVCLQAAGIEGDAYGS